MADIRHNVTIKTGTDKVYEAITTQQGIESWWCKQTTAKPEVGFVNVFIFGKARLEMKVKNLEAGKRVEWECTGTVEEWTGTNVIFDLEEKDGNTLLRFTHGNWKSVTDLFATCCFDWATFLRSLKTLCETGAGQPQ